MVILHCPHCGTIIEIEGTPHPLEPQCEGCGGLLDLVENDRKERLERELNELESSYGHGSVRDGLVRDRAAAVRLELAS